MAAATTISDFIQRELATRNLRSVAAIDAAKWLDAARLLKDLATRRGKPLQEKRLRRSCRACCIKVGKYLTVLRYAIEARYAS